MLVVPTQPVPAQTFNILLGGQDVTLNIYARFFGLFMDVTSNGTLVIAGVLCQNLNRIVRDLYLGFVGDFIWVDNQGSTSPTYQGLGTRYTLIYLEAADLPAGRG